MTPKQDTANMDAGFGAALEITEAIVDGMGNTCVWTQEEEGWWETECGNAHIINEGTPADNGMKFCGYCGKPLEQVLYVEED